MSEGLPESINLKTDTHRHKYARYERERRFLVPSPSEVLAQSGRLRRLADRYIDGTTLRLRRVLEDGKPPIFKLTQKIAHSDAAVGESLVTTMYLTQSEYSLLDSLPGRELGKTRVTVAPFGIDIFEGELRGLAVAEVELGREEALQDFPLFLGKEVSADRRFSGAALAQASRADLSSWLADYQLELDEV